MANKRDMDIITSKLKDDKLRDLIITYGIPLELNPRLPDPDFRMTDLPADAIGIYSRIFDSSSVRIPFSSFLLAVIKYFKVHISQIVPLGLSKVITFEVLCRALNIEPTVTLFRVFQTLSKAGHWFSFSKRRVPAPVCMEDTKTGLKDWKHKFFLIDRRAIPEYMPWRHPDSCVADDVPTSGFSQDDVNLLKANIIRLRDIPEGVLVLSGLSRVWLNPVCDPVLRRHDDTDMSIHDFLLMPSWDGTEVREEPHGLDTSLIQRVVDRATPPALVGTAIPAPTVDETIATRAHPRVVTKAKNAAKRKASTRPEVSTYATRNKKVAKKNSEVGSSERATSDGSEQVDGDIQDNDTDPAADDFEHPDEVNKDKEVSDAPHADSSVTLRETTQSRSRGAPGTITGIHPSAEEAFPDHATNGGTRPPHVDHVTNGDIPDPATDEDVLDRATDEDVHHHDVEEDLDHGFYGSAKESGDGGSGQSLFIDGVYYKAVGGTTSGDRLERELLPLAPGPYCMSYPHNEGSSSHLVKCLEKEWGHVHHTSLGLLNKELFKDPKVCKSVIDRVPTPAELYRVEGLSPHELTDRMSVFLCQMLSHGSELSSRYTSLVKIRDSLSDRCREQTRTIKRQAVDLEEQTKITVRANEKVAILTGKLKEIKKLNHDRSKKNKKLKAANIKLKEELADARATSNRVTDELAQARSRLKDLKRQVSMQESETHECRDLVAEHEREINKIRTNVTSFFHDDFEKLVRRFLGSGEFNQALAHVASLAVSSGFERGLRMGRSESEFQDVSRMVSNFIPGAEKKFNDVVASLPTQAFPFFSKVSRSAENNLQDIAQLEPDKIVPPRKAPSTAATSSGRPDTRTLDRSTTLPTKTFGYTSTPEHLKTKKASK